MKRTQRINETDLIVGRRIRLRRLERHVSQTQLANALGLTFQQVQKYEKGVNRISAGRLEIVARFLDVPITFFFAPVDGDRKESPTTLNQLQDRRSVRLLQAFSKIKDKKMQAALLRVAELMANEG
jgi:transcriptional regulator with XRE-family HTH domain